ncbi:unnamed protein product [Prorocentrum cordatum]|uniref:DUF1736 domain-containing protein n=1 Tax=Prorocentrum cordatum TaxID=2364126 RepID=A0ABN9VJP0_9DINO|nr:unnamed protein product [Polarella glacialis]
MPGRSAVLSAARCQSYFGSCDAAACRPQALERAGGPRHPAPPDLFLHLGEQVDQPAGGVKQETRPGGSDALIWQALCKVRHVFLGVSRIPHGSMTVPQETGFTIFGLFLLVELLDFVDEGRAPRPEGQQGGRAAARVRRRTRTRVVALAVLTLLVFAARYRHTGGTSINMSPQDNPISFEASQFVRTLSYAYLHGVYAKLLVWPQFLCYDYSMDAIPSVRTLEDPRLLLPLAAYVGFISVLAATLHLPARYRRAGLMSLALLVATFFPASNILS